MVFFVVGLLLKIGAAPFHYWFASVCRSLTWGMNLILITWQKFSPLIILRVLVDSSLVTMFLFMGLVGLFFGSCGGLLQTQRRPLFAYSSIAHMGWMVCLVPVSLVGLFRYLGVYVALLFPLLTFFSLYNFTRGKVGGLMSCMGKQVVFIVRLLIVGLAGIPPFSGFFIKAYGVYLIVGMGFFLVGFFFIFFSALRLVFYTNIVFIGLVSLFFFHHGEPNFKI